MKIRYAFASLSMLVVVGCETPLPLPENDRTEIELPSVEVSYVESFPDGRNVRTIVTSRNRRDDSFRRSSRRSGCSGRFNNASRLIAGSLGLPPDFFNERNSNFNQNGRDHVIEDSDADAEWRVFSRDDGGIKSIRVEVIRTFRGLNDNRTDIDPQLSTSDPEARIFSDVNDAGHNIVVIERVFAGDPLPRLNGLNFNIGTWTSDAFQIFVEDGNGQVQRVNQLWLPAAFCLGMPGRT